MTVENTEYENQQITTDQKTSKNKCKKIQQLQKVKS